MNGRGEVGSISVLIFSIPTRWMWMVSFTPWSLSVGEELSVPLNRRLGGPQGRSGRFGKINFCPCQVSNYYSRSSRPSPSYYALSASVLYNTLKLCSRSQKCRHWTHPFRWEITGTPLCYNKYMNKRVFAKAIFIESPRTASREVVFLLSPLVSA
jgi:hypothetical protein